MPSILLLEFSTTLKGSNISVLLKSSSEGLPCKAKGYTLFQHAEIFVTPKGLRAIR